MTNYVNLFCFFAICFVAASLFIAFSADEQGKDDEKRRGK